MKVAPPAPTARRILPALAVLLLAAGCTSSLDTGPGPEEATASETPEALVATSPPGDEPTVSAALPAVTAEAEFLVLDDGAIAYGWATNPGDVPVRSLIGVLVRDADGSPLAATDAVYVTLAPGSEGLFVVELSVQPDDVVDSVEASVESIEPAEIDGVIEVSELTLHTDAAVPMVSAHLASQLDEEVRGATAHAVCTDSDGTVVGAGFTPLYQQLAVGGQSYVELPILGLQLGAADPAVDAEDDEASGVDPAELGIDCELTVQF